MVHRPGAWAPEGGGAAAADHPRWLGLAQRGQGVQGAAYGDRTGRPGAPVGQNVPMAHQPGIWKQFSKRPFFKICGTNQGTNKSVLKKHGKTSKMTSPFKR